MTTDGDRDRDEISAADVDASDAYGIEAIDEATGRAPKEIDSSDDLMAATRASYEAERLQEELAGLRQDRAERRKFANVVLAGLGIQVLVVDVLLFLLAAFNDWQLDETTLQIFLASTVIELVGVVYVVANYLFPQRKPD